VNLQSLRTVNKRYQCFIDDTLGSEECWKIILEDLESKGGILSWFGIGVLGWRGLRNHIECSEGISVSEMWTCC